MSKVHKLKGVARKAVEKVNKADPPATYVQRSNHTDEQIRHVLLKWMEETLRRERYRQEQIAKELAEEQARLAKIQESKRVRNPKDYKKIQERRAALQREPVSHIVPGCFKPNGVRMQGAADGTGASYRIVRKTAITANGVEEQLFEERIE